MNKNKSTTILFLGDRESPLLFWLSELGYTVVQTGEKIDPEYIKCHKIDFLVSYGYRHIIRKNILDVLSPSSNRKSVVVVR